MFEPRPILEDIDPPDDPVVETLRSPTGGNWLLLAGVVGLAGFGAAIAGGPRLFPGLSRPLFYAFMLMGLVIGAAGLLGLLARAGALHFREDRRRFMAGHLRCSECGTLGEFGTVCRRCGALHPLPEEAGIHPVYGTWPGEGGPPMDPVPPKDRAGADSGLLR